MCGHAMDFDDMTLLNSIPAISALSSQIPLFDMKRMIKE